MRAALAIFRFELRLLRKDVFLSGLVLAGVLAAVLAGGSGTGDSLTPLLKGSVLVVLVLVGLTRVALVQDAWTTLRLTQPIAPRALALSGAMLWAVFALMPACAYVLWIGPAERTPLLHALCVWLWLLLAGTAAGLLLGEQSRRLWTGISVALAVLALVVLSVSLDDVVDGDVTGGLALRLGLLALLTLLPGRLIADEWLPTQSPKEVKPRKRIIGGLKRKLAHARSPRQVLAHMGVRRLPRQEGLWLLFWIAWCASLIAALRGEELRGASGDIMLLVAIPLAGGLFLSGTLRQTSASWAFLRAYPLRRSAVWGRALAWMSVLTVLGLGALVTLYHVSQPDRIVDHFEGDEGPFAKHGGWGKIFPAFATPHWVREDDALEDRPEGMPRPEWGRWPVRPIWRERVPASQSARADDEAYFGEAVRFYLDLVHGVEVADAELTDALGEPFILEGRSADVPEQHFFEDVASRSYGVYRGFVWWRPNEKGEVGVRPPPRRTPGMLERRALHAFAPALDRLQAAIGDRVTRALWLRTLLDACVLVFSVLLFVRLALLEGPLRYALPLLAAVPLLLCFGGRGTALWRAIRDAHLATPWIAPAVTVILVVILIVSIRRQLGRTTPESVQAR